MSTVLNSTMICSTTSVSKEMTHVYKRQDRHDLPPLDVPKYLGQIKLQSIKTELR